MDEEIRHITNTNLVGTMVTTKAFIKSFMKTMARNRDNADKADFKTGSIINLSSLLGIKRGAGSTAYAASKAGILGFTRALAHEMSMREGRTLAIRVNAIVPGYIDTPMLAGTFMSNGIWACVMLLICFSNVQILPIAID